MNFEEFKNWLKAQGLTFRLEGWSGCIMDTIIVMRDGTDIYTGTYDRWTDYAEAVSAIENGDAGGAM